MSKAVKIATYIFITIVILSFCSCAPAKKNTYYQKKRTNSHVDASQLGRNKYYFSSGYQKKLQQRYKKQ